MQVSVPGYSSNYYRNHNHNRIPFKGNINLEALESVKNKLPDNFMNFFREQVVGHFAQFNGDCTINSVARSTTREAGFYGRLVVNLTHDGKHGSRDYQVVIDNHPTAYSNDINLGRLNTVFRHYKSGSNSPLLEEVNGVNYPPKSKNDGYRTVT